MPRGTGTRKNKNKPPLDPPPQLYLWNVYVYHCGDSAFPVHGQAFVLLTSKFQSRFAAIEWFTWSSSCFAMGNPETIHVGKSDA